MGVTSRHIQLLHSYELIKHTEIEKKPLLTSFCTKKIGNIFYVISVEQGRNEFRGFNDI